MKIFYENLVNSLKSALGELSNNKVRTFLSLAGISFGIFCIISVLAVINSMKTAITDQLSSIAQKTVFVGKWENEGGGPDYPWWKYVNRPEVKLEEMELIEQKLHYPAVVSFMGQTNSTVENNDRLVGSVNYYGVTEGFNIQQALSVEYGRNLQPQDYEAGSNLVILGYTVAEELFGEAQVAVGKNVKLISGKTAVVVGTIPKKGSSIIDAWNYDECIIMPYGFLRQLIPEKNANPSIMVQGKGNTSIEALKEELLGIMRSVRKLSPTQEKNFSLTDIDSFSKNLEPIFTGINIGGWAISGLSLLVGMFGVANIMFVTVRERTNQIGLKKAVGAKKRVILAEFLTESAFLCILGGLIGLIFVFILAKIISHSMSFPISISPDIFLLAIFICIVTGVIAGIIPAMIAARMDPVVAIRSK